MMTYKYEDLTLSITLSNGGAIMLFNMNMPWFGFDIHGVYIGISEFKKTALLAKCKHGFTGESFSVKPSTETPST